MSAPLYIRDDDDGRVFSSIPPVAAAPPARKVEWKYDGPMTPGECFAWASFLGGACLAGAVVTFVTGGLARWLDAPALREAHMAAAANASPLVLVVVSGSVFFGVLLQGYKSHTTFHARMLDHLAPPIATPDPDELEEDEPAPSPTKPDPRDVEFAQCVAVLKYAFSRGGSAPVPRTKRNGVKPLPLPTVGGTLDGNEYKAVASKLRDKYKLMTGGQGEHWGLAQSWDSLNALLDEFERQFNKGAL